jgi:hypothetical protein
MHHAAILAATVPPIDATAGLDEQVHPVPERDGCRPANGGKDNGRMIGPINAFAPGDHLAVEARYLVARSRGCTRWWARGLRIMRVADTMLRHYPSWGLPLLQLGAECLVADWNALSDADKRSCGHESLGQNCEPQMAVATCWWLPGLTLMLMGDLHGRRYPSSGAALMRMGADLFLAAGKARSEEGMDGVDTDEPSVTAAPRLAVESQRVEAPCIDEGAPMLAVEVPCIDRSAPVLVVEAPCVDEGAPVLVVGAPCIDDGAPVLVVEAAWAEEMPVLAVDAPCAARPSGLAVEAPCIDEGALGWSVHLSRHAIGATAPPARRRPRARFDGDAGAGGSGATRGEERRRHARRSNWPVASADGAMMSASARVTRPRPVRRAGIPSARHQGRRRLGTAPAAASAPPPAPPRHRPGSRPGTAPGSRPPPPRQMPRHVPKSREADREGSARPTPHPMGPPAPGRRTRRAIGRG